jgi:predicted RNase H-like HicB family nuclease
LPLTADIALLADSLNMHADPADRFIVQEAVSTQRSAPGHAGSRVVVADQSNSLAGCSVGVCGVTKCEYSVPGRSSSEMIFHVTLEKAEDGWIVAECPALPGCVSQGKDEREALENIREAITAWLWAEDQKAIAGLPRKPKRQPVMVTV